MLHIAVCDDDACFVKEVSQQIAGILNHAGIPYTLSAFSNGIQLLENSPYDLVFLDVEMPNMDGMETARRLQMQESRCCLVFLTAYRQYVFAAFDVEASHYLIKPVQPEKLQEVLLRLARRIQNETGRCVAVRQGGMLRRIPLEAIHFIEVLDRKVFLHTGKGVYDFYGKLERFEQELPEGFFRCHRSYIVNFQYVRRYDKLGIRLSSGESVPVSKRKYAEFCKSFLYYLKKKGELL